MGDAVLVQQVALGPNCHHGAHRVEEVSQHQRENKEKYWQPAEFGKRTKEVDLKDCVEVRRLD